ncbi:MAG TPA: aminotransferase class III-fold pyridoxal phosphate-dependent enzyme [Acidimicrobiia bacterium]
MSGVFGRGTHLPIVKSAKGAWIEDGDGRRYLDAGGSAAVSSLGHGESSIVDAITHQAVKAEFVHATQFTSEELEAYAVELAEVVPVDDPWVFPVSGGAEAIETAFKLARAYHLARGEDRHVIVARRGDYHGNTLGALDASGRAPLRRPYEPWLGRTRFVPAVYEYRCPAPSHPEACGVWHAGQLETTFQEIGPGNVAAFVAEPICGATLGAAVPPEDYWSAIAEVCSRHRVLLVVDEVMTGFGRTGSWFAVDHWGIRPDILVAAKGASGGYWPLGLCVASGSVHEAVAEAGFVHGFTFSHHPVGAAVGRAVLNRIKELHLIEAARQRGRQLLEGLRQALGSHPVVGDVRGRGLLVGIELVADRETRRPFPRSDRLTERLRRKAMDLGLLLYGSTGCVDGTEGDLLLIAPPLTILPSEIDLAVELTAKAIAETA